MTNEAPTQDEVEGLPKDQKAAKILVDIAMRNLKRSKEAGDISARITLDHIAALEAKLAEQIREDEMRLINHCVKIIGNNSKSHIHAEAEFLTKIAELEADNKRLVEVLKDLVEIDRRDSTCDPDIIATDSHREETWSRAKAAIAQTGEK